LIFMKLLTRFVAVAFALLILAAGVVRAQTGAVSEISREARQVRLALTSGPHPWPGSYTVTVFLPPDYDATTARYPVLYIFDGSDIHSPHDMLVEEGLIQPAILVSIANKPGSARQYDLTPYLWGENSGGLPSFADLITGVLKPYVDAHFRTRADAASTGVMGNSLGGLASCWLGYTRPETFGFAGCHEPSLWWSDNRLLLQLQRDTTSKTATRFWIMAADQEFPDMWRNAKQAAYALTRRGWREGEDVAFCQVHNYSHGFRAVETQLRSMLHFFLRLAPPELVRTELTNCHGPQLVPLRPSDLGGSAFAYLDLHYRENLRMTAIAPTLEVADPGVVLLRDDVSAELVPAGTGWTTVSAVFGGFRAVIDIQGYARGSPADPPVRASAPQIVGHPESQTIAPGRPGSLAVATASGGEVSYQWRQDGALIPGATHATLDFAALSSDDAGDYTVIATNASGSTLSRSARLLVAAPEPGRLVNVSVRANAGVGGQPLIIGFVVTGRPKPLLLRAVGPELARSWAVEGAVADPWLAVHAVVGGDRVVGTNDDWSLAPGGRAALVAAFDRLGAFPLPADSRDAALLLDVAGPHTVHAAARGPGGILLLEAYDAGTGNDARLVNISARNHAGTGNDVLIAGFVINGNVPKRVLVRGIGPALTAQGVAQPLADPQLEVHAREHGRDQVVATNDNWAESDVAVLRRTFAAVGAFPLPDETSRDAALRLTLPAGVYSAVVSGVGGTAGEALVEVYEEP
jgi:predicted alpha/beta superfamily hydrolase